MEDKDAEFLLRRFNKISPEQLMKHSGLNLSLHSLVLKENIKPCILKTEYLKTGWTVEEVHRFYATLAAKFYFGADIGMEDAHKVDRIIKSWNINTRDRGFL